MKTEATGKCPERLAALCALPLFLHTTLAGGISHEGLFHSCSNCLLRSRAVSV